MKTIFRKLLPTAAAISLLGLKCHAAYLMWTNIAGGNWGAAANWNPNQVPTTNDNVVISDPATYQIVLDAPASTSNFTFTAASCVLTGNFALTIEGKLTWSGGVLAGNSGNLATTVKRGADLGGGPVPPALNKRFLSLQGQTRLSSRMELRNGAKLRVETNGTFEALDGGEFYHPNSPAVSIENLGTFRILPGAMNFSCFGSPFANSGTLEIQNRTNRFDGFTQDATNAVLRLTDAAIPDGASIDISRGALLGRGSLRLVQIGSPSFGPPATASGTFSMETLTMGHYCKAAFTIGGRTNGNFDHFTMTNLFAITDPALEVRFANGFENSVLNSDVFAIVSAQPGLTFSGEFGNVPFGQRLLTADLAGTFVVDTNSSQSVVLRDFQPSLPYIWIFSETNLYPFAPNFCFLDSNAIVAIRPGTNVTWSGGQLNVQLLSSFDPANDSLRIQHQGEGPGQIGVGSTVPGSIGPIRYGGAQFATFSNSPAGQLICTFEASATAPAIQALLRSMFYTNNQFSPDLFGSPTFQFPGRTLRLALTESVGYSANNIRTQAIAFPVLQGIQLDQSDIHLLHGSTNQVSLLGLFSNEQKKPVPNLAVNWSTCPLELFTVAGVSGNVFSLTANYTVLGNCFFRVSVEPFEFIACVHIFGPPEENDGQSCLVSDSSLSDTCVIEPPEAPRPASRIHQLSLTSLPLSLPVFRALEVLMNHTTEGQRLSSLYWQHTREISAIVRTNPTLIAESLEVFHNFQPGILDLLGGRGTTNTISQAMIDQLNGVWNELSALGSPQLQSAMATERNRFNDFKAFVGKNFSEWATLLDIPAPTQPFLYLSSPGIRNGKFFVEANDPGEFDVQVWASMNLTNWQPATNARAVVEGAGLIIIETNLPPTPRFYQLRARPK